MAVPAHVNAASARRRRGSRRGIVRRRRRRGGARRPRLGGSRGSFGDGRRAARDEKRDGSRGGARARHRLARLAERREVSVHLLRATSREDGEGGRRPRRRASVGSNPGARLLRHVRHHGVAHEPRPRRDAADVSHGKRHNARSNPASAIREDQPRRRARPTRETRTARRAGRGERRLASSVRRRPERVSARTPASTVTRTLVGTLARRARRSRRSEAAAISHAPIAERSSIGKSDEEDPRRQSGAAHARHGANRIAASRSLRRSAARKPPGASPEGSPARIPPAAFDARPETTSASGREHEGQCWAPPRPGARANRRDAAASARRIFFARPGVDERAPLAVVQPRAATRDDLDDVDGGPARRGSVSDSNSVSARASGRGRSSLDDSRAQAPRRETWMDRSRSCADTR